MMPDLPTPLATRYPEELGLFKKLFLWGCSKECVYTRSFYEETVVDACYTRCRTQEEQQIGSVLSGFLIPRWRPLKTKQQTDLPP